MYNICWSCCSASNEIERSIDHPQNILYNNIKYSKNHPCFKYFQHLNDLKLETTWNTCAIRPSGHSALWAELQQCLSLQEISWSPSHDHTMQLGRSSQSNGQHDWFPRQTQRNSPTITNDHQIEFKFASQFTGTELGRSFLEPSLPHLFIAAPRLSIAKMSGHNMPQLMNFQWIFRPSSPGVSPAESFPGQSVRTCSRRRRRSGCTPAGHAFQTLERSNPMHGYAHSSQNSETSVPRFPLTWTLKIYKCMVFGNHKRTFTWTIQHQTI